MEKTKIEGDGTTLFWREDERWVLEEWSENKTWFHDKIIRNGPIQNWKET